jgi:hypothetical protein
LPGWLDFGTNSQFHFPTAMHDAETVQRDIVEVRGLIEQQQDLIAGLVVAGLNACDIEATLKALTAQLELLEQQAPKPRPS